MRKARHSDGAGRTAVGAIPSGLLAPCQLEDAVKSGKHLLDAFEFLVQMFSADFGHPKDPYRAVPGRQSHLCFEPASLQHALEGGIEGALLDLEIVFRNTLKPLGKRVAVHRPPVQALKDHQLESTGK